MISRYFGSKTQEFPVPDDEAPLRLLLFHACRLKFYYTPHYKPEKYHRYCQISLLFASNYHHSSFPMYLFRHRNKKNFLRFLRDGYSQAIHHPERFWERQSGILIPCHQPIATKNLYHIYFSQEPLFSDHGLIEQKHHFSPILRQEHHD